MLCSTPITKSNVGAYHTHAIAMLARILLELTMANIGNQVMTVSCILVSAAAVGSCDCHPRLTCDGLQALQGCRLHRACALLVLCTGRPISDFKTV